MSSKERSYISFGSQMGDIRAADVVQKHLIELRRFLQIYCQDRYADKLDRFALVLRVDGDTWFWNFEGCQNLRLMRGKRYITVDIGMPRNRWEGASDLEIRRYLVKNLKNALHLIVSRLKKEYMEVDEEKLFFDFAKVEKEFLEMTSSEQ